MLLSTLRAFARREPVLLISLVCAVISMFFCPPSAAYLGYIDTRVLILLFCLMAVVAGMQKYGVFDLLAQKLLSGRHALRTIVLFLTLLPFFASMLITNDVALITFVPFAILVLGLVGQQALLLPVIVLQTGAHIGKGADIARKQEKTHKGQQQAVIDAAKDIPVKQDERSTGEHEQRHVGQDMKNGQQA